MLSRRPSGWSRGVTIWLGVPSLEGKALARVLTVDKDALILELLKFLLGKDGHRVHPTPDPDEALGILQSTVVDLVTLEIALPRHDGMRLCHEIRQLSPFTPIMIISERNDEEQIVRGLAAADDYVVKPFSPRLLLARVAALVRRASLVRASQAAIESPSCGGISLDFKLMQAVVDGHRIGLTPRELSLLHVLMVNANHVLSRNQLIRLAWGDQFVGTAKAVDVNIQRIRGKISSYLDGRMAIQSLRGFGYILQLVLPAPQPTPTSVTKA